MEPFLQRMSPAAATQKIIEVAPTAWANISQAHLDSLIESMPRRVEAVVEAQGWYTKY